MNFTKANKICKRLSSQYGIINPPDVIPLKYSRMGKCVALGYYDNHENTVEINKHVMRLWTNEQIQEIIQHELIHTRCYQDFGHGGHGKRFQILASLLDIPERVRVAKKNTE